MRMLTDHEVAFVAGGTGSSDFYDGGTGSPYANGGGYEGGGGAGGWYWIPIPGYVGGDESEVVVGASGGYWTWMGGGVGGSGAGSSSGGTGAPANTDIPYTDDNASCEDGAAVKAGAKITELVNTYGSFEFTGVIVQNADGSFGMANDEISTRWSPTSSAFDDLGDYTDAYGVVHNHPFNSADYNDNFIQRYPGTEDWQALDRMVAGGANPANLAVYLLDPFGVMREFKYSDRALYQSMTDSERMQIGGPNLPPATTACGG